MSINKQNSQAAANATPSQTEASPNGIMQTVPAVTQAASQISPYNFTPEASYLYHQAIDRCFNGGAYIGGVAYGVPRVSYDPANPPTCIQNSNLVGATSGGAFQTAPNQYVTIGGMNANGINAATYSSPAPYANGANNLLGNAFFPSAPSSVSTSLPVNSFSGDIGQLLKLNAANSLASPLGISPLALALSSHSVGLPTFATSAASSLVSPMLTNPLTGAIASYGSGNAAVTAANAALAGMPLQLQGGDKSCSGKIFVGGLSQQTTNEGLRNHFGRIGAVKEGFVKLDQRSQRSRGFGFVTFYDPLDAVKAISTGPHVVDGKYLDVKQALPHNLTQDPDATCSPKKVYVGGLPHSVDTPALTLYFQQFGPLEHAMVMKDPQGKSRGFGYVTYESEDRARFVVGIRFHYIHNTTVECKKSQPKNTLENEKAKNGKHSSSSSNGSPHSSNSGDGQPGLLGPPPSSQDVTVEPASFS